MASKRPIEPSPIRKQEDAAARIVREGVDEAIREMERVVTRYLAEGKGDRLNSQQITQMVTALENIAREYGVEIAKPTGDLAQLLTDVRSKGAVEAVGKDVGLTWLADNKDALDIALHNDKVKIKGILAESTARINEIITTARLSGKSRADTVDEIMTRMDDVGKMTKNRAETIYRSETFSGYRQFSTQAALDEGIEYFQFINIVDSRTEPICLELVGQIKTMAEWEAIEPLFATYGAHYGCRGRLIPVRNPEGIIAQRAAASYERQAARQIAVREEQ